MTALNNKNSTVLKMRHWKIFLTYISLVFMSFFWLDISPIHANESITSKKINLAGRQRMLSQRIAKASCYISTFTEVPKHVAILRDSINSFEEAHNALKLGSRNLQLPSEKNTVILAELKKLDPILRHLNFASTILIETPHLPGLDMDIIAELDQPALAQANEIVKAIEQTSSNENSETNSNGLSLNKAINLAGRQRMLIQKATKEFCFITYGLNVLKNEENLLKTIHLLDRSFNRLIAGDPDQSITVPPTVEIANNLKRIKAQWLVIRHIMKKTNHNELPQSNDFKIISDINEPLMEQMDSVVKLYVEHSQANFIGPPLTTESH